MAGKDCDVCMDRESAGVFASSCGPISFAYCERCSAAGYEPWMALIGGYGTLSPESIHPEAAKHLNRNCKFHGKTVEEFWQECQELWDQYEEESAEDEA